jgi:hypothetical protein
LQHVQQLALGLGCGPASLQLLLALLLSVLLYVLLLLVMPCQCLDGLLPLPLLLVVGDYLRIVLAEAAFWCWHAVLLYAHSAIEQCV